MHVSMLAVNFSFDVLFNRKTSFIILIVHTQNKGPFASLRVVYYYNLELFNNSFKALTILIFSVLLAKSIKWLLKDVIYLFFFLEYKDVLNWLFKRFFTFFHHSFLYLLLLLFWSFFLFHLYFVFCVILRSVKISSLPPGPLIYGKVDINQMSVLKL